MDPYCSDMNSLNDYGTFDVDHADLLGPQKQSPRNEDKDEDGDDLPIVVFFALVAVGMWKPPPRPELTSSEDNLKRCNLDKDIDVRGAELPDITDTITTKIQTDEKDVGDIDFIALKNSTKKKTAKRVWRNVLIDIAYLMYLSTLTIFLLVDGGTYLYNFWGLSSELLYMISYITFILQILFGPMYALMNRLSMLLPCLDARQCCPLDVAYVLRRVRVLRTTGNGHLLKPRFLFTFISWPLGQAILRAITWLVINHQCHLNYFLFSDISAAWGLVAYGFFWYLVYIERASLHHDLNRVVKNVKRISLTDDVDAARREIRRVHRDYLLLRELMGVWMAITMVTTSWGLLTRLSWDYAISGQSINDHHSSNKQVKLYLDIIIWSEKIMLIAFPCVALGGMNLEYLWQRFYHALEGIRSYHHHAFWMAIQQHASYIDHIGSPELKWTLVFALIGPYLSLQSSMNGNQKLDFWNGPFRSNCSES